MALEQLKPSEFDAHVANGTFRLAFVGMSNVGKSYRSNVLHEEAGFLWYHVDEEIQKALELENLEDVSRWLGYPTSEGYSEREKRYLELEDKFTEQAAMQTDGKNLVFDTTGSVVHLKPETIKSLRENCLIVHLDVGKDAIAQMLAGFFEHPKPVAWAGYLYSLPGEPEESSIRRCYPKLLADRLQKYRTLAHINIPATDVRDTSAKETLAIIRAHLD